MKKSSLKINQALESRLVQARKSGLRRMGEVEHRLEFVDEYKGVEYINDAKAMDVNSSWYSIDSIQKPIIWIVNSSRFEKDYSLYNELDTTNLRAVIVMGTAQESLFHVFTSKIDFVKVVNELHEAVNQAMVIANEGDCVLFSPACEDFETFKHYKEAGQLFRKAVRETRL